MTVIITVETIKDFLKIHSYMQCNEHLQSIYTTVECFYSSHSYMCIDTHTVYMYEISAR